jgi:hypothetical protein
VSWDGPVPDVPNRLTILAVIMVVLRLGWAPAEVS